MKRFITLQIFIVLLGSGIFGQDIDDVSFNGRYIHAPTTDTTNWKFYDDEFFIDFHVHQNISTTYGVDHIFISTIANEWHVTGSNFNFNILPDANNTYPILDFHSSPHNQYNVIGVDLNQEYFSTFNLASNDPLAHRLGYTARYHNPDSSCTRWFNPWIWGADIVINKDAPIKLLDPGTECNINTFHYDFHAIMLHELGHAAGLQHYGTNNDVMTDEKQLPGRCHRRFTSSLDRFAIERLYSQDYDTVSSISCAVFDRSFVKGTRGGKYTGTNTGSTSGYCNPIPKCTLCKKDAVLTDEDYDDKSKLYRAQNSITASDITIGNGSNIELWASISITIKAPFSVDNESYFRAQLTPECYCDCPNKCILTSDNCGGTTVEKRSLDDDFTEMPGKEEITPYTPPSEFISNAHVNQGLLEINYQLSKDLMHVKNVMIFLFDAYGRQIQQVKDRPYVDGSHHVKLDVSRLATGFYFYNIVADHRALSEKLMIVNQ